MINHQVIKTEQNFNFMQWLIWGNPHGAKEPPFDWTKNTPWLKVRQDCCFGHLSMPEKKEVVQSNTNQSTDWLLNQAVVVAKGGRGH